MVVIESQYFPCLAYFSIFINEEEVLIEACENYSKQTYRNRCIIRSANKVESLSIPVLRGNSKIPIRDVRIDYTQSWMKDHWRAIQSAYGKAPYFEFYADYFRDIFNKKHEFLFDLNRESLTLCLKFLQMETRVRNTDKFEKVYESPFLDLRGIILPGKDHRDYSFFRSVPYPQIFGKDFVDNLSVLDLLFCEGPNARILIKKSVLS